MPFNQALRTRPEFQSGIRIESGKIKLRIGFNTEEDNTLLKVNTWGTKKYWKT
jgi:hypothetical protein